jgi:hypothetical protein
MSLELSSDLMGLWLASVGALGLVFVLVWMVRASRENRAVVRGLNLVTMEVELGPSSASPPEFQERLEDFLNLIHSLFSGEPGFSAWLKGQKQISFEGLISARGSRFYLQVPRQWQANISRYLYGPFPEAKVRVGPSLQIFNPKSSFEISGFKLKAPDVFPLKMTLEARLGRELQQVLAKLPAGHQVVWQIVVSGLSEDWNIRSLEKAKHLEPGEAEIVRQKASYLNFLANLRLLSVAPKKFQAQKLHQKAIKIFLESFKGQSNELVPLEGYSEKRLFDFIYRVFNSGEAMVLSSRVLGLLWTLGFQARDFLIGARTNLAGLTALQGIPFVSQKARLYHFYCLGATGTGKTALLANLALEDIKRGQGIAVVDPHGDLTAQILGNIPRERLEDVIYFDPSQAHHQLQLNLLEAHSEDQKHLLVQEILGIFEKLFPKELIGPVFEHNMRNIFLTLMADFQNPGTLADVPRMLTDPQFARRFIEKVRDPLIKDFWYKERELISEFHKSESLQYLISKLGRFIEDKLMRRILDSPHSSFSFDELLKDNKILLANLAKGKIGELNSKLLGLILVSKLQVALFRRPLGKNISSFGLYIDEFPSFITKTFDQVLSESRKFGLSLYLAHQYLGQLDRVTQGAILGNVGTIVSFRVGLEDAQILSRIFFDKVSPQDLIGLENYQAVARTLDKSRKPVVYAFKTSKLPQPDEAVSRAVRRISHLKFPLS